MASADLWKLSVQIGGLDVTPRIVGEVAVTSAESAASLAEFTMLPFAGAVNAALWVGKPVAIQYAPPGGSLVTLFTGIVDTPVYDPSTRLTRLQCTDGLQLMFDGVPPEGAMAVIGGGQWSSFIFERSRDGWSTFNDIMSTQQASFNLDSLGHGVLTPWGAKATPDFAFDESSLVDRSLSVSLAGARDIVNSIELKFEYRYARLWEFTHTLQWNYDINWILFWPVPGLATVAQSLAGTQYAVKMARGSLVDGGPPLSPWVPRVVQSSVPGASASLPMVMFEPPIYQQSFAWQVQGVSLNPIQGPGPVGNPTPQPGGGLGTQPILFLSDSPRYSAVGSFGIEATTRFQSTATETHVNVLNVPASIAAVGRNPRTLSHGISAQYEGDRLTNLWTELRQETVDYPVSAYGVNVHGTPMPGGILGVPALTSERLTFNRHTVDRPPQGPDATLPPADGYPAAARFDRDKSPIDGRAEMNLAYSTAMNRALRTLAESHRLNRVSFQIPLHSIIDLSHTVQVQLGQSGGSNQSQAMPAMANRARLPSLRAKGKVYALKHTMDTAGGRAVTEVTLALSGAFGAPGATYSAPAFDVPVAIVWNRSPASPLGYDNALPFIYEPSMPFSYDLGVWPPDSPWDFEKYKDKPLPRGFRGWNAIGQQFIMESPPPPPDAVLDNRVIAESVSSITLHEDLLEIEA